MDKKENLKMMFVSNEWVEYKWIKYYKGFVVYYIIWYMEFWDGVGMC